MPAGRGRLAHRAHLAARRGQAAAARHADARPGRHLPAGSRAARRPPQRPPRAPGRPTRRAHRPDAAATARRLDPQHPPRLLRGDPARPCRARHAGPPAHRRRPWHRPHARRHWLAPGHRRPDVSGPRRPAAPLPGARPARRGDPHRRSGRAPASARRRPTHPRRTPDETGRPPCQRDPLWAARRLRRHEPDHPDEPDHVRHARPLGARTPAGPPRHRRRDHRRPRPRAAEAPRRADPHRHPAAAQSDPRDVRQARRHRPRLPALSHPSSEPAPTTTRHSCGRRSSHDHRPAGSRRTVARLGQGTPAPRGVRRAAYPSVRRSLRPRRPALDPDRTQRRHLARRPVPRRQPGRPVRQRTTSAHRRHRTDASSVRRVDLTDVVTGIDRANLDLVLAALAHAGGSHQHARPFTAMLHTWPCTPAPSPRGMSSPGPRSPSQRSASRSLAPAPTIQGPL